MLNREDVQTAAHLLRRFPISVYALLQRAGLFVLHKLQSAVKRMGPYLDAVKSRLRSQALRVAGSLKRMGALLHESCAQIGRTFASEGFRAGVKALCSCGLALIRAKNYRPVTMASAMLVLCVAFTFMMGRGALVYSQAVDTTGSVNSRSGLETTTLREQYLTVADSVVPTAKAPAAKTTVSSPAKKAAKPAVKVVKPAVKKVAAVKVKKAVKKARALSSRGTSGRLSSRFPGDPFNSPQCVWYAWGRAREATGISLQFKTESGRSARHWLDEVVQTSNVKVVRDRNAVRADSIAVFYHGGGGNGHVVFVESVSRNSKGNPVSVVISESNFNSRRPTQTSMSWGEFLSRSDGSLEGYIYLG